MSWGFVNVAGLSTYKGGQVTELQYVVFSYVEGCSLFGDNSGISVVYLPDGTVWLRGEVLHSPPVLELAYPGAFVPGMNGEFFKASEIFKRVVDPSLKGEEAVDVSDPQNPKRLGYFTHPSDGKEAILHPMYETQKKDKRFLPNINRDHSNDSRHGSPIRV